MIAEPVARLMTYVRVWLALMALLAITLGSAYLPLSWGNLAVNITVSCLKALLVMVFFMHLRQAGGLLRLVSLAGFLWLAILLGLASVDFFAR